MYSIANKPEHRSECEDKNRNDGWFICQECHQLFCSQHSIIHHHHQLKQEQTPPTERYDRYVHLDQIAEWERKAIEKIRKQADKARRPLIAPPTLITQTSPSTILVNELNYVPLTRLLTHPSNIEKQSPIIDPYELLSDERSERQNQQQPTATPYNMDTVVPKTIFDRNNPVDLKRIS